MSTSVSSRRFFLSRAIRWGAISLIPSTKLGNAQTPSSSTLTAEEEKQNWMNSIMGSRAFDEPAVISKFQDGMFYLRAPIVWRPNRADSGLPDIAVPTGFVTDLASIPRPFWSLIPRDGPYADAAIVHDYLYWRQNVTKDVADMVLQEGMRDLEVFPATVSIIYGGVRTPFGDMAWASNQRLKSAGERRILKLFPKNPAIKWSDWKLVRENFLDE